MKHYVGIDLGGTNIVAAVLDEDLNICSKVSCKTNLPKSSKRLANDMADLVSVAVKKARLEFDEIESVGIGIPGFIDSAAKMVKYSCNFNYHDEPLAIMLQDILKKRVSIENDANAAALGEFFYRKKIEPQLSSMVLLTLGTGIGGGIVINGHIYSGFNFCGGEIGHMIIKKGGRLCNCGRRGCFETYASATGLLRTTREFMERNKNSKLWQYCDGRKKLSGKITFDVARQGDATAVRVKRKFLSDLGEGVVNVVNIFQPQLVCIGGGISKEGRFLLDPLQEFVKRYDYAKNSQNRCRVEMCRLKNDAGLVGAAMLCVEQNY